MPQYDIFEIYPDGSFRWRACVYGQSDKERKLQELAEISDHQFCAIDIAAGETLPLSLLAPRRASGPKQDGLTKTG